MNLISPGHSACETVRSGSRQGPRSMGLFRRPFAATRLQLFCAAHRPTGIQGDGDRWTLCANGEGIRTRKFLSARKTNRRSANDRWGPGGRQILAVLVSDVAYGHIEDIGGCQTGLVDSLSTTFLVTSNMPGAAPRRVEISDVYDRGEAFDVIERSLRDYRKSLAILRRDFSVAENWILTLSCRVGTPWPPSFTATHLFRDLGHHRTSGTRRDTPTMLRAVTRLRIFIRRLILLECTARAG